MSRTYSPKLSPKTHQAVGVEQMLTQNLANFDDQGLGKCKQAYDLAGKMFEEKKIDLMVMICKASLKENFHNEVSKDAYQLISRVVAGSRAERKQIYKFPSSHVLVVSFENAITDVDDLLQLLQRNRTLLCLDEAHYIKNPSAQRTQACLELSLHAVKTAIFSGTPIPNKVEDIYTQMRFLGHDVGGNLDEFRERFGSLEDFRSFLSARMIRRKKDDLKELNLPPKTVNVVNVELSSEERKIYQKAADDMFIEFRSKLGNQTTIPINGILAKLIRLAQITSNPALLIDDYDGPCTKIDKLDEIVRGNVSAGEKIIIWTSYRKNVRLLLKRYSEFRAVSIYGESSKEEISAAVKSFQEGTAMVLIAVPACAREGFTLTRARKAVYLDRNFNLLDWVQSQDRIHRISQTRECEIIVLEATDTLDQRIDEVLARKDHLQKYLLGDIEEYTGLENITRNEVLELVGGPENGSKHKKQKGSLPKGLRKAL